MLKNDYIGSKYKASDGNDYTMKRAYKCRMPESVVAKSSMEPSEASKVFRPRLTKGSLKVTDSRLLALARQYREQECKVSESTVSKSILKLVERSKVFSMENPTS